MSSHKEQLINISLLDDGLPSVGYLRCDQILKIIPISRSLFWQLVKERNIDTRKVSPRVTLFLIKDIRRALLGAKDE
jgi:hypothetical protein